MLTRRLRAGSGSFTLSLQRSMSDGPEVALHWLFPDLNFFDSAQCLMVRRWRFIGHFPILYNPLSTAMTKLRIVTVGVSGGR
jgi:hypothetical protein